MDPIYTKLNVQFLLTMCSLRCIFFSAVVFKAPLVVVQYWELCLIYFLFVFCRLLYYI